VIKYSAFFAIYLIAILLVSCKNDPIEEVFTTTPFTLNHGSLPPPTIAADNQLTVEGIALGRMLFYDKKLSGNNTQSCASCHRQEHAFTDTARFSLGIHNMPGKRQAMSVFNMAWHSNQFFWDGRANLLRDQALLPIQDELEMDETLDNVVGKLVGEPSYKTAFKKAFGTEEINALKISLALEQFMNSIVSYDSKYDQHLAGTATLTPSEQRGLDLFFAEFNPGFPALSGADCAHCHSGKNFENDRYLNNALDTDVQFTDLGREEATGEANDRAKFKVTSLRNIALTAPYMHDGRFSTLEEVVDHYNAGMQMSTTIDPALIYPLNNGGLGLTNQDKTDLVAFLKTLSDQTLISNPDYSNPF